MENNNVSLGPCAARARASDKGSVIRDIAHRIASALGLPSVETVVEALERREELGSTGLENGVAVPHCSVEEVDRFVVGMITLDQPIDFGAIDGRPSDIFVYIAGPGRRRDEHVRILAAITSSLRRAEVRERARKATDDNVLIDILSSGIAPDETDRGPSSLMTI